ncbi:hypothetical protein [Salmonella enterica]|uniref:hypothetical protein n=1 Tax=Salmonella enterica TaxID=28901 RepID=UPI000A3228BA|nr:hypothetical protein [Salmonella enterica]
MNLHGIVSGAVRRVNPYTDALVYRSRGSTQQADYSRVPEYEDPVSVRVQKQAVTQAGLRHLDNLNQQGVFATLYTDGNWCGLNRTRQQGGDKFVIGDETWLVVEVPEIWPDWTRVIVCLQV